MLYSSGPDEIQRPSTLFWTIFRCSACQGNEKGAGRSVHIAVREGLGIRSAARAVSLKGNSEAIRNRLVMPWEMQQTNQPRPHSGQKRLRDPLSSPGS
jgi:hypothetical protein